ncbi:MAG TPA: GGDEF domain-containing protein [Planctomycetota bacterium]|nr:GGDEF domain-containing protein [Planctomycetota bacterium]
MRIVKTYLAAFGRPFTYDVRQNVYLWFGLLWGLPVPIFSIILDLSLGGLSRANPLTAIHEHPIHLFFLAHPALFAVVFGAMGTVRHDLEAENRRLIDELTGLATTDALTGLHNRRYVTEELQKAIHRSERSNQPFSIVLFDLDKFKQINDERGHGAGDIVLRGAAGALASITRQGDVLGRYGGDEFLLVAYGDLPSAMNLAERANEAVKQRTGLSVSAGVARFPEDGVTPQALIDAADTLLASTKRKRYEKDTARR